MSVRVELDREDRTYRPGEPIAGRVVVRAPGRRLETLELTLAWVSGDPDTNALAGEKRAAASHRLAFRDEERSTWQQAHRFEVPCPDGPASVQSGDLRVAWELRATARFADHASEGSIEFELEDARQPLSEASRRPPARDRRLARIDRDTVGQGLAATAFGLIIAAAGVWLGGFPCIATCGAAGAFVVIGGLLVLRNPAAERRLGTVHLEAPAEVDPGETAVVFLSFQPPRPLRLNVVEVRLTASEVRRVDGSTVTREAARITERPALPALVGRDGLRLRVELPLPESAPPTCEEPDRRVTWSLEVRVDVPRWPDWVVTIPLRVAGPATREREVIAVPRIAFDVQPGQRCPFCRDRVAGAGTGPVRPCGACGTILHAACWAELTRCPSAGCDGGPRGRGRDRVRG